MTKMSHVALSVAESASVPTSLQGECNESNSSHGDWQRLLGHAGEEVATIAEQVCSLFPAGSLPPVTLHLYQPVPIEAGESVHHRLVDIGPRPTGWETGVIAQVGGETGSFFQGPETYRRFVPSPKEITREISDGYRKANHSLERRTSQVTLEKTRYPNIQNWPKDQAPPQKSWIYQLPLSPLPARFGHMRQPVLGVVYTLSTRGDFPPEDIDRLTSEERTCAETIYQLPVYAMRAGIVALENRLELIVGSGERKRILSRFNHASSGERCMVAASLVLSHHWFFRDPVAQLLVQKLLAARDEPCPTLNGLWTETHFYGSKVSSLSLEADADSRSPAELFRMLCSDLEQLIALATSDAFMDERRRTLLREAVASMLMIMTGELYCGPWPRCQAGATARTGMVTRFRGQQHAREMGLLLLSPMELVASGENLALCMPVIASMAPKKARSRINIHNHLAGYASELHPFEEPSINRTRGAERANCWSIASGMVGRQQHPYITYGGWPENDKSDKWMQWLRELTYYRVAQEYYLQTGRGDEPEGA